jgi:hypothetical protein
MPTDVTYTSTRYETLLLASTGAFRITRERARGVLTRYRVLRTLRDSEHHALSPSAAASSEARTVMDLWRGGLISAQVGPTSAISASGSPVKLTTLGYERLAAWQRRWRAHRSRRSTAG